MSFVDSAFRESNEEPAVIDVRERGQGRTRRHPYRSFNQKGPDTQIGELSVYAKAPDKLAQVWNPPVYATFRFDERVKIVSFYASSENARLLRSAEIMRMAKRLDAGAAYRFSYPLAFSPVAYINGLSFEPNQRSVGTLTRRDEVRVSNYRDHCWRGKRAHDGFFRDIYDLILLNERAASRTIGTCRLKDWITADERRGSITTNRGLSIWKPGGADPRLLQDVLDSAHILLAGFAPDDSDPQPPALR